MSDPKPLNVVWIGTGVMGASMCKFLLQKPEAYNLSVHNRTKSKTDELVSMGATWVDLETLLSPNNFDVAILMTFGPAEVEDLFITKNLIGYLPENSLIIDHTSSSPAVARKLDAAASKRNIHSVDAPVSGGDVGAQNGTLQIMAGGSETGFERAERIMKFYIERVTYLYISSSQN